MTLTDADRTTIRDIAFGQWGDRERVGELIYIAGLRAGMLRAAEIANYRARR